MKPEMCLSDIKYICTLHKQVHTLRLELWSVIRFAGIHSEVCVDFTTERVKASDSCSMRYPGLTTWMDAVDLCWIRSKDLHGSTTHIATSGTSAASKLRPFAVRHNQAEKPEPRYRAVIRQSTRPRSYEMP